MAKNNKLINSLNEIARRNRSQNVATAADQMVPQIYAAIAIALHRTYGFGYKRMRRLKRLMKNFKNGTITEEFFDKSLTSRIGSVKHADTYNLVEKITCEAKELKESHA